MSATRLSLAVVVLLGACGGSAPGLRARVALTRSFASSVRCAQGPFELTIPANGHRWGESIELRVKTPRAVKLIARVERAGGFAHKADKLIGGRGRPDNRRCVVGADEVGSVAGGGGRPPGATGPRTKGDGETGGTTTRAPPAKRPVLVSVSAAAGGDTLVRVSWRNPSLEPPALHAGDRIRIRIWSLVPNDLQGVVFTLRHFLYVPSGGDDAFVAYLRKLERKRAREDEARRKRAERRGHVVRSKPVSAETRRRRRAEQQRRRAQRLKRQAERRRRARLRRQYCASHLDDRECWGPGGFRVHAAMDARAAERARYCKAHRNDARCWTKREWYERRLRWHRRLRRAAQKPQGPPPSPRAETKPPWPSEHAQWRPGYWHWSAGWKWIAGRWRVPQTDVDRGLTTKAPQQPPPPKREARPQLPVPSAVWIVGYWQWNGSVFVWVPGSWQLPPSAGVRWQPPHWRVSVGGVVFVPGRWIGGAP